MVPGAGVVRWNRLGPNPYGRSEKIRAREVHEISHFRSANRALGLQTGRTVEPVRREGQIPYAVRSPTNSSTLARHSLGRG